MEKQIVDHPLHPSCPLDLDSSGMNFVCSGCKLPGSRVYMYRCRNGCDFRLHGQCATCPEKLSFWGHPQHELVLDRSRADVGKMMVEMYPELHAALMSSMPYGGVLPTSCEMCTAQIDGMHYHCPTCGLFLHTVCAMLPKLMRSAAHPEHDLALFCSAPTMCSDAVCRKPAVWAYRCVPCLAFYHLNCLPENAGVFTKPFSNLPPNPFIELPPPMMMGPPGMVDEANPFGLVHTYRHRGL